MKFSPEKNRPEPIEISKHPLTGSGLLPSMGNRLMGLESFANELGRTSLNSINGGSSELKSFPRDIKPRERLQIMKETGWPRQIVNHIDSFRQYTEVYKPAGLHFGVVDGRPCLLKNHINLDYVNPKTGETNREIMAKGKAPFDEKTGQKIQLHHMGQRFDSPLAELTPEEHCDGHSELMHPNKSPSWRNDPTMNRIYGDVQRPNHWRERAKEMMA